MMSGTKNVRLVVLTAVFYSPFPAGADLCSFKSDKFEKMMS